jgi:hypothetical protein
VSNYLCGRLVHVKMLPDRPETAFCYEYLLPSITLRDRTCFTATHERRPMSEQTPQVVVVDNDSEIRKLLAHHLESRDPLMDLTRGREGNVPGRSVDFLVGRLRPRRGTSATSRLFKTVRDGGYQLAVDVALQDLPS